MSLLPAHSTHRSVESVCLYLSAPACVCLRLSAACICLRLYLSAACREWLRHQKTLRLPEQRATQSQLARIRELQLPLTDAAAATLTSAQVRGLTGN